MKKTIIRDNLLNMINQDLMGNTVLIRRRIEIGLFLSCLSKFSFPLNGHLKFGIELYLDKE